jgi:hypothetical protein
LQPAGEFDNVYQLRVEADRTVLALAVGLLLEEDPPDGGGPDNLVAGPTSAAISSMPLTAQGIIV